MDEPKSYGTSSHNQILSLLALAISIWLMTKDLQTFEEDDSPWSDVFIIGLTLALSVIGVVVAFLTQVRIWPDGMDLRYGLRVKHLAWDEIEVVLAITEERLIAKLSNGDTVAMPGFSSKNGDLIRQDLRHHLGPQRTLQTPYMMSIDFCQGGWAVPAVLIATTAVITYWSGAAIPAAGFAAGLITGLLMLRAAQKPDRFIANDAWPILAMCIVPLASLVYLGFTSDQLDGTTIVALFGSISGLLAGIAHVHSAYRQTFWNIIERAAKPWPNPDDSGEERR